MPVSLSPFQEQNPNLSPDGSAIVWEQCPTPANCNVMKAVRTGQGWTVSSVADTPFNEENPDTDGTWVVYDADRNGGTGQDIFIQPLAGGPEIQLAIPGSQVNPSISKGVVGFESTAPGELTADLYLYVIATNTLYRVTSTSGVNESLNDVSVLGNGDVRIVWAADDGLGTTQNIYGATISLAASTALTLPSVTASTGHSSTFVATLTSAGAPVANEPVRFSLSGVQLQPSAITNAQGSAALAVEIDLAPGFYPGAVRADFTGDSARGLGPAAVTADLTVTKGATSMTLSVSPNPATYGQTVTLTGAILSGSVVPDGQVRFASQRNGQTSQLGLAAIDPATGVATLTVPDLAVGTFNIVATYDGSALYLGSVAGTTVTIAVGTVTVELTSSARPSLTTAPPVFTATIHVPASTLPTGAIDFFADGIQMCHSTVFQRADSNVASCGGALLAIGDHVITASYSGDSSFGGGSSNPLPQTVLAGDYFMVDLGTSTPATTISRVPVEIRSSLPWGGFVAGATPVNQTDNSSSAFLFDGTVHTIPSLGGTHTSVVGVDDLGRVTGSSTTAGDATTHAFVYASDQTGDLGTLTGGSNSRAAAINGAGAIVGYADLGSAIHAVRWLHGQILDLGVNAGPASAAVAVSQQGDIAGVSSISGAVHAALLGDAGPLDLGTLGGASSTPAAVNDASEVAGVSDTAEGAHRAFLFRSGAMLDIAGIPGSGDSSAHGLNDAGQVAGSIALPVDPASGSSGTEPHAFLFGLQRLTDLGTGSAVALNNAGMAVGLDGIGGAWVSNGAAKIFKKPAPSTAEPVFIPGTVFNAINDAGQIVGSSGGHGALWIPVAAALLTLDGVSGRPTESVTLSATLNSSVPLGASGKTLHFLVNDLEVATGVTDASGRASASLSLAAYAPGDYPGAVSVVFPGDATLAAAAASSDLDVQREPGAGNLVAAAAGGR